MIATIKYQVATYSGTVQVHCNEDEEEEVILPEPKISCVETQEAIGLLGISLLK